MELLGTQGKTLKRIVVISIVLLLLAGATALALTLEEKKAPLPAQVLLEKATGQPQARNLSCESRSASDLAAFWGFNVPEAQFLEKLPRSDNPHKGFVGSPDDPRGGLPPNGYGVYAEPVAALLQAYGLPARAEHRRGLNWLREELAAGQPVIVWATYGFRNQPVQTYRSTDGQEHKVVPFEHTFLVMGYTPTEFQVIDAFDGKRKSIPVADFERGWSLLDQMAVAVKNPSQAPSRPISETWQFYGLPLAALLFLALALISARYTSRQSPAGGARGRQDRVPAAAGAAAGRAGGRMREMETATEGLLPRSGARGQRPRYGYAQTFGAICLIVGLLLSTRLSGFNPCLAIPLVVGCGALGFILGYQIENLGR